MVSSNKTPTVSVVMAVYNGERHLTAAIDSILTQTVTDFEFIIVDDGSSDNTAVILNQYAAKDDRIRVITNVQNSGLTKSLNKGISQARGYYIARQDADDISNPDRLAEQVAILNAQPDIALVTSHFTIDENNAQVAYRHLPTDMQRRWAMLFYNHISGHTGVMFRKDAFDAAGGYDESFRYAQDYDLWERLSQRHKLAVIERVLFTIYMHDHNLSRTKLDRQTDYALRVSQRQIERLVGDVSELDVHQLYYFWTHEYNRVRDFRSVHQLLKQIYSAFMVYYQPEKSDRLAIRRQIAGHFWRVATINGQLNVTQLWFMAQWSLRLMVWRIRHRLRSH